MYWYCWSIIKYINNSSSFKNLYFNNKQKEIEELEWNKKKDDKIKKLEKSMKKNNEELNSKKNIFEKEKDQLIKNNNILNIIISALNTENENLKNGNQKLEEDTAKLKSKKKT